MATCSPAGISTASRWPRRSICSAIALTTLQAIAERRVERLVNPDLSQGLPAFLTRDPGLSSGFMMVQITAASLVAESRTLAMPASIGSIPTDANQEDFVPMGMAAAFKARRILANAQKVVAAELLCGAQGLEFLRPLRPGRGVERLYRRIRATEDGVPPLGRGPSTGSGPRSGSHALVMHGARSIRHPVCLARAQWAPVSSKFRYFIDASPSHPPRWMNFEKLKEAARKYEQKEEWRRAIEVYLQAIREFEAGNDPVPDLSLYNRVGDLYLKANEPGRRRPGLRAGRRPVR